MADRVYHWKHGWIPLDHVAADEGGPTLMRGELTPDEQQSIEDYVHGGSFMGINAHLRGLDVSKVVGDSGFEDFYGGEADEDFAGNVKQEMETLDSAIQKSRLKAPTTVYRSFDDAQIHGKTGGIFTDEGYGSTTTDQSIADKWGGNAIMKIDIPANRHGLWVDGVKGLEHMKQSELLLPRGVRYSIKSVTHENGHLVYHVTLVGERQGTQHESWRAHDTTMAAIVEADFILPALENALRDDPELVEVITSPAGAAGTEKLHAYWRKHIPWGTPGDFDYCVSRLGKYIKDPKGYCAKMHKDVTGARPGHAPGELAASEEPEMVDLQEADRVYHWKHGWIPLDHTAASEKGAYFVKSHPNGFAVHDSSGKAMGVHHSEALARAMAEHHSKNGAQDEMARRSDAELAQMNGPLSDQEKAARSAIAAAHPSGRSVAATGEAHVVSTAGGRHHVYDANGQHVASYRSGKQARAHMDRLAREQDPAMRGGIPQPGTPAHREMMSGAPKAAKKTASAEQKPKSEPYPLRQDGTPDYGAMSAEQAATVRAEKSGRGVGAHVSTDQGPGHVTAVNSRGTTVKLESGETIHVVSGTPGHSRIQPIRNPDSLSRVSSGEKAGHLSDLRASRGMRATEQPSGVPDSAFHEFSSSSQLKPGDRVWDRHSGESSGRGSELHWQVQPATVVSVDHNSGQVELKYDNGGSGSHDYYHLAPTIKNGEQPPAKASTSGAGKLDTGKVTKTKVEPKSISHLGQVTSNAKHAMEIKDSNGNVIGHVQAAKDTERVMSGRIQVGSHTIRSGHIALDPNGRPIKPGSGHSGFMTHYTQADAIKALQDHHAAKQSSPVAPSSDASMSTYADQLNAARDRFDTRSRPLVDKLVTNLRQGNWKAAQRNATDIDGIEAWAGHGANTPTRNALIKVLARVNQHVRNSKESDVTDDNELEERDFSGKQRKKLAKSGAAMSDGSFPIENASDLANAIQAVGRASDPAAAKVHIRKRAKALGLTSSLPDSWNSSNEVAIFESLTFEEAATPGKSGRWQVQAISAGLGSSGYYPAHVLEDAATKQLIKAGTPLFFDHPSESGRKDRPERSVRDIAAVFTSPAAYDPSRQALVGEVQVFGPYRELVSEMAPHIGLSIRGSATDVTEGPRPDGSTGPIIEGLAHIDSVDLVTKAGRGGKFVSLLESAREQMYTYEDFTEVDESSTPDEEPDPSAEVEETEVTDEITGAGGPPRNPRQVMEAQLAEQQRKINLLQAGQLATGIIAEELAAGWISSGQHARITASLMRDLPLTESGELDEQALRTRARRDMEEAESEGAEILSSAGVGKPRGLGLAPSVSEFSDAKLQDELVESFKRQGLSESAAINAARGR